MRSTAAAALAVADLVRADAAAHGFALDPAQEAALPVLAGLATGAGGGAYLWGAPGRGKTWLVDAVLRAAAPRGLLRAHFHDLYAALHAATGRRYARQQVTGAWEAAVAQVLDGVQLLVLDELHLSDSDDVWIAERVLRRVLDGGGALVVTSNHAVDALHQHPLWAAHADGLRALLHARAVPLPFDGAVDHRADGPAADRPAFSSGALLAPGGALRLADLGLTAPSAPDRVVLVVGGRELPALAAGPAALWLRFGDLCDRPTSAADAAELAGRWRTWVLAGVPVLAGCSPDVRARFLTVVDVAHDRDVRLVLVARQGLEETAGPPDLLPDWPRLLSRLALLRR